MELCGFEVPVKNAPVLDKTFIPMAAFNRAFEQSAADGRDLVLAVEREQGQVAADGSESTARRLWSGWIGSMSNAW